METMKWRSASRRIQIAIAALCMSVAVMGSVLRLFTAGGSPAPERVELAQCRTTMTDRRPIEPPAIGKRPACGVRAPPEKS
jgi:hypothetical protein